MEEIVKLVTHNDKMADIVNIEQKDSYKLEKLFDEVGREHLDKVDGKSMQNIYNTDWADTFGLYDKGEIVAAATIFYSKHTFDLKLSKLKNTDKLGKVAEIGYVVVRPDYRGNNLGHIFIKKLLNAAKWKRVNTVIAEVDEENKYGEKTLKSVGMHENGDTDILSIEDVYVER